MIRGSDHVVDLGPGAGAAGGQVLYTGPLGRLFAESRDSATSDYLSGRKRTAGSGTRAGP